MNDLGFFSNQEPIETHASSLKRSSDDRNSKKLSKKIKSTETVRNLEPEDTTATPMEDSPKPDIIAENKNEDIVEDLAENMSVSKIRSHEVYKQIRDSKNIHKTLKVITSKYEVQEILHVLAYSEVFSVLVQNLSQNQPIVTTILCAVVSTYPNIIEPADLFKHAVSHSEKSTDVFRYLATAFHTKGKEYLGIGLLKHVSEAHRDEIISQHPVLQKLWKKQKGEDSYFPRLAETYMKLLSEGKTAECKAVLNIFVSATQNDRKFIVPFIQDSLLIEFTLASEYHKLVAEDLDKLVTEISIPVHDQSLKHITKDEYETVWYNKVVSAQKLAFKKGIFQEIWSASAFQLENKISVFDDAQVDGLVFYCQALGIKTKINGETVPTQVLVLALKNYFKKRPYPYRTINPILEHPVPRPNIKNKYHTFEEYLHTMQHMFAYHASVKFETEIRNTIMRCVPRYDPDKPMESLQTLFGTIDHFALPLDRVEYLRDVPARIGHDKSHYMLEIQYDLSKYKEQHIRDEWDSVTPNDTLFLCGVSIEPFSKSPKITVRTCTYQGLLGDDNLPMPYVESVSKSIQEAIAQLPPAQMSYQQKQDWLFRMEDEGRSKGIYGNLRTVRVCADGKGEFNILVRPRKDGVIQAFREIMRDYGENVRDFCMMRAKKEKHCVDVSRLFIDEEHCQEVCGIPGSLVVYNSNSDLLSDKANHFKSRGIEFGSSATNPLVSKKPYEAEPPVKPRVRLNADQVNAIVSATDQGLSIIKGSAGTGKTEVALHLVPTLLENFPSERILIVSPSSTQLDLFLSKLFNLVDHTDIVRVGTEMDGKTPMNEHGRIHALNIKKQNLLARVSFFTSATGYASSYANDVKSAAALGKIVEQQYEIYKYRILNEIKDVDKVFETFPFKTFFEPKYYVGETFEEKFDCVQGLFASIKNMFTEIERLIPWDAFRTSEEKGWWIVTNGAKVVCSTTWYMNQNRKLFDKHGMRYESVIFLSAEQVQEHESLMTFLGQAYYCRNVMKRCVFVGDAKEVKLGKEKFDSMMVRCLKNGHECSELKQQVRCNEFVNRLLGTKYSGLEGGKKEEICPGFVYATQFINVPDFKDEGEVQVTANQFKNLGEAEYIVAVYMYMRLVGYPNDKISIVTLYEPQKHQIQEVLNKRCAKNPLFGQPSVLSAFHAVETEYMLLATTRTKTAPALDDVLKCCAKATKGLYSFGRKDVLEDHTEYEDLMKIFSERPTSLSIQEGEEYGKVYNRGSSPKKGKKKAEDSVKSFQTVEEIGKYVYDKTAELLKKMKS